MCNQARAVGVSRCCLSGDTLVALADGTSKKIRLLAEAGVDVNVLALDTNGVAVPRLMHAPHATEKHAITYRVTFENDRYFDATAGHLLMLASHAWRDICKLDVDIPIWYSKRTGPVVTRSDKQQYRAHGAVLVPSDLPGRPVKRTCEYCGIEFTVPYAKRDSLSCSETCRVTWLARVHTAARASVCANLPGTHVKSVNRIEPTDAYNGTVTEFHNVCIVPQGAGQTTSDFLVAVSSL